MTSNGRAGRTAIKRPGAGVTIDRARLVRMRQEKAMSRAQLAAAMSHGEYTITPDAIAKIENGSRRPKTTTLARFCSALGCQPEDLLPALDSGQCRKCQARYGHEPGCEDAT